jgi:hypothetical protein
VLHDGQKLFPVAADADHLPSEWQMAVPAGHDGANRLVDEAETVHVEHSNLEERRGN